MFVPEDVATSTGLGIIEGRPGVVGSAALTSIFPLSSNLVCMPEVVDPKLIPLESCPKGALVVKDLTLDDAEMDGTDDADDDLDGCATGCLTVVVGVRGNTTEDIIAPLKLVPAF